MANPAAAHPHMPVVGLIAANRGPAARRARLLNSSGVMFLISTAASIVVVHTAGNPSAIDDTAYALIAFVLFLLGVWLVLIAVVADQFPRAARVAVAVASTLHGYLIGQIGGN